MQTSIENINAVTRKITVTIPNQQICTAVDKKINEIRGKVKIDGFRNGKVPLTIVKQHYSSAVRADIINDLIQNTYSEVITTEKINPVAMPKIDTEERAFIKGDFTYKATVEVYPEFELANLSKIKVNLPTTTISETDIDDAIEKLRQQHKVYVATKNPAAKDDQVTIDFVGSIDGVEFDGGKAEAMPVVIGSKSMIDGFEDGLIGLKSGQTTTLNLRFPKKYQAENLAGKPAKFEVKITEVAASQLPELNTEFLEKFNIKDADVTAFKAQINKGLVADCQKIKQQFVKTQILDAIADAHRKIELPKTMIKQEIEQMVNRLKSQMQGGNNLDKLFNNTDGMRPEASKRVITGLVLSTIIEQNKITLDATKFKQFVKNEAANYNEPQKAIDYFMNDDKARKSMEPLVLGQQVIDYIVGIAKTKEVKLSFSELTKKVSTSP